jgi:hypothetical protein
LEIFIEVFAPFLKEVDTKMDHGESMLGETCSEITKLIIAYGEDPKNMEPKDFFAVFFQFHKDFSETYASHEQRQKAAKEKLQREAKKKAEKIRVRKTVT